jgi:RHS repeat-associated protein
VLADENLLEDDVFWALADHLGTVRRLVDNAGNAIRDRIFSAWGQVVEDTNPDFVFPFAFTGREYDVETGLYYYRARYYDPHTGRFLSEAPLSFAAGDANLSRYVFNSPPNYTDPSGMVLLGNDRIVTQVMPDGTQHLYYVDAGWLWNDAPVYIGTVCTINGTTLVYRNGKWALITAVQREVSCLGTTSDWETWFSDNCYDPFTPTYQNLAYLTGNLDLANRRKQAGHHAADLGEELMWVYATTPLLSCTPGTPGLGRLTAEGGGVWRSSGGLRYGPDARYGNRVRHVLRHAVDDATRAVEHGVFDAGRVGMLGVIDEAWSIAQGGGARVTAVVRGSRVEYTVDMGRRIGYIGGRPGAAAGNPAARHIRLVIENGSDVVTAYPVIP